jgi:hypothetical protein
LALEQKESLDPVEAKEAWKCPDPDLLALEKEDVRRWATLEAIDRLC